MALFHNDESKVIPAKRDQAGYDGTILLKEGGSLRTSIKNYGMSVHETRFEQQATDIEVYIKQLIVEFDCPPLHIVIDSPVKYPDQKNWNKLKDNLGNIFERKAGFTYLANRKDESKGFEEGNTNLDWTVILHPFEQNIDQYHPAFKSYTLIISGLYHKNEHENLFSKIDDACVNLTKHALMKV